MSDTGLPDVPPPGAAKEPLLTVGTITAIVTTGLACLVAFGIHMSDDRQSAILGIVAVLAPLVVAAVGRAKAWSPASVRALAQWVRADERGRHAAKDTSEADVRDVRPGWLPPNVDPR